MLDLQQKLKRTIIFVSHDLDEAFKLGNRIALMEGGRIVQLGTAREIISSPVNDYVQDFVAHMNPLGVLTAHDAMLDPQDPLIASLSVSREDTVDAHEPIKRVMQRFNETHVNALAVTEAGQSVGMLTRQSVLNRLAR